jgi:hypothetical protein
MFLLDRTRRTVYMAISFVLTYGSLIGIGYFFGIWVALAAFAIKLLVRMASFHHYFNQAVREHAEWEYREMLRDRDNANAPLEKLDVMERFMRTAVQAVDVNMDESTMRQEAYRRARFAIEQKVKRG